jgi:hypothetical protein
VIGGIFGFPLTRECGYLQKDAPTPGADLKDMQCSWYLIEEGDAYRRAGNLPLAVKRYEQVIAVSHHRWLGRSDLG